LPPEVDITAQTEAGEVMGLHHAGRQLWGVQFHPESIGSQGGAQLMGNWLKCICRPTQ
jgi:anthranilate/para-aminobenzoate synthase component II